ncbi:MAG: sensor histidine kinase [Pseudomonadota bacterium]
MNQALVEQLNAADGATPEGLEEAFRAFNRLAEELSDTYQDLENQVAELTAELQRSRAAHSEELAEKERLAGRLESLVQALPAGVVVLDAQGRVQEANPVAHDFLGSPLEGMPWTGIIERAFDPAGAGYDLRLNDGRLVSLSTCPLGSEPGQILLLTDVSEARAHQERSHHQKRLESMGEMAASLAHQVRTPLSSALLYAGHLRRGDLDEQRRQMVAGKITDRLQRLEKLVNDMLIFAKGGIGGAERVRCRELVDALEAAVASEAATAGVEVIVEGALDDEPAVHCNRDLLLSAARNLATNAIQAMENGGELHLRVREVDAERIDLEVADTGPGIPEDQRERLFEPFYTTRTDGTGLGLAVVRAVAHAHHGDVWVESEEGGGSRFGIRLPRAGADNEPMKGTARHE